MKLQLLIEIDKDTIFEETANLSKTMWRKFFDVSVVLVLWIVGTYCNDLVIFLSLNYIDLVFHHICLMNKLF